MKTTLEPKDLTRSVIAVPPLCRDANLTYSASENQRLIRYLEEGGVRVLLYGGNANFYHIALSEYENVVGSLFELASPETVVIPSVGPQFGMMMDQASVVTSLKASCVMVLPGAFPSRPEGVHAAILKFQDKAQVPVVVYLKEENYLTPELAADLVHRGGVAWIKYAIVRDDPEKDPWLESLLDRVPGAGVISGIGEQPARVHMKKFGLGGFTSGCVNIAPHLSMNCLRALQADALDTAESLREIFKPLEDLRNAWGPIPVLHHAVALADIAETGPMLPLLADLQKSDREIIGTTARSLFAQNTRGTRKP